MPLVFFLMSEKPFRKRLDQDIVFPSVRSLGSTIKLQQYRYRKCRGKSCASILVIHSTIVDLKADTGKMYKELRIILLILSIIFWRLN